MPGFFGIVGQNAREMDRATLTEIINPLSLGEAKALESEEFFISLSSAKNSPVRGEHFFEDERYVAVFTGDLVGYESVPWGTILGALTPQRFDKLAALRGTFAIAILEKHKKELSLISDLVSLQPLYYLVADHNVLFSTAIAAFSRIPNAPSFNERWLYELLFFNYPIQGTTFFENVKRMPPASVLQFQCETATVSVTEYSTRFRRPSKLLTGIDALREAKRVFGETIPKYFQGSDEVALGLSAGLDSRTILSFVPEESRRALTTYTYGRPKCADMVEARDIAQALGIRHTEIPLDGDFLAELPKLIHKAVNLSNGLQGINRSHLDYIYRKVTNNGQGASIVVTGNSGDHLFRDHIKGSGNIPQMISQDMMSIFWDGRGSLNSSFYEKIFADRVGEFEEHVNLVLDNATSRYGELASPEAYLSYLVYEAGPGYLGGDASLANSYSTFRSPYWDPDIIRLSYHIDCATLGWSERYRAKDVFREKVLQAFLIQQDPSLKSVPYQGVPIGSISSNNKLLYSCYRLAKRGPKKLMALLTGNAPVTTEDWQTWYRTVLDTEIDRLLGEESLVAGYISRDFIGEMRERQDIHWLGKMITAELTLRSVSSGWSGDI